MISGAAHLYGNLDKWCTICFKYCEQKWSKLLISDVCVTIMYLLCKPAWVLVDGPWAEGDPTLGNCSFDQSFVVRSECLWAGRNSSCEKNKQSTQLKDFLGVHRGGR